MRRKLIAMDLDGTAVDSEGRLAPGVKEAIVNARAEGHMVAFVTGRADTDMAALDCGYEFVDYLILNNGAKLVRGHDRTVLENEVLNRDEVERLIRFCQERDIQVYVICGRECYASKRGERLERYMENYLSMMMCICSIFLRMIDTDEAEDKREGIWDYLKEKNPEVYRRIRRSVLNMGTNLPTGLGRKIGITGYRMAQKIFKFN